METIVGDVLPNDNNENDDKFVSASDVLHLSCEPRGIRFKKPVTIHLALPKSLVSLYV